MPDSGIEMRGLDKIVTDLGTFNRAVEDEIEAWAISGLQRRVGDLAAYPPPPPNSTYVRTGDLGAGWRNAKPRLDRRSGSVGLSLHNLVPYTPFVQGDQQARIHAGRWRKIADIDKAQQPQDERDLAERLERLAKRLG